MKPFRVWEIYALNGLLWFKGSRKDYEEIEIWKKGVIKVFCYYVVISVSLILMRKNLNHRICFY